MNILKDADEDAAEGRKYLPAGVPRADVFGLARRDLGVAGEYVEALHGAGAKPGILEFTALPVALAWATLSRVEDGGRGPRWAARRSTGSRGTCGTRSREARPGPV